MKLLLIGPYPPPHGGISVHVCEAKKRLDEAGVRCEVLSLDRRAAQTAQSPYARGGGRFLLDLFSYARRGWTFHLHTNGHNEKSWMMALICGLAGQLGPACILTLHSGMAPMYLRNARGWRRLLARVACRLYDRIIAVNPQIRAAVRLLGVAEERLHVLPAYLSSSAAASLPASIDKVVRNARPLLSTVLFFRPEYGFAMLAHAVSRLRVQYSGLRCVVMGSGEQRDGAERLITDMGLSETMLLLGDVPHEQCLAVMAASDVFVRATFEDGDAISVREALSLGVPVVASDAGVRPPGAILFDKGNLADLIAKLESTLSERRDAYTPEQKLSTNGAHGLLEIYQQVCADEAA
ncbi:MAG: glycosyltransferase family 4 protein [Acidobacteria bacterium]|nr:glycosyltransferase family 4 protein [Acidobacteriota bacterium]